MLLWALGEPDRLSGPAREAIAEGAAEVLVSAATIWELAIKRSIGRLEVDADLVDACRRSSFSELGVSFEHAQAVEQLPLHHRDPFDRLLIAQARVERITVTTADPDFADYDVDLLPAAG